MDIVYLIKNVEKNSYMKSIILILFICVIGVCYSQSDDGVYYSKYWNYRYALRGDDIDPSYIRWEPGFLEVGFGPGTSLPMRSRRRFSYPNASLLPVYKNKQGPCVNINFNSYGRFNNWALGDEIPPERKAGNSANTWFGQRDGLLVWHDVPTDLGKYLIALATELGLLTRASLSYNAYFNLPLLQSKNFNLAQQLQMTYTELSRAIDAVNRLDYNSDIRYGNSNQTWDGVFIRDDVPDNFADDGKFGNAELLTNNYWNNTNIAIPYYRGNSFSNVVSNNITAGQRNHPCDADLQISKDQFLKLTLGVIAAKKYANFYKAYYGDPNNVYQSCFDFLDRAIWATFPTFDTREPDPTSSSGYKDACKYSGMTWYSPLIWDVWNMHTSGDFTSGAYAHQLTFGQPALLAQKLYYTLDYPIVSLAGIPFTVGQTFSDEIFGYACIQADAAPMFIIPNSLHKFGCHLGEYNPKELEYEFNYLSEAIRDNIYGMPFKISTSFPPQSLNPIGGVTNFVTSTSINIRWFPTSDYTKFMDRWNFCDCEHDTRNWYYDKPTEERLEEKNGLNYMIAHNLYLMSKDEQPKIDVANNQIASMINLYDRRIDGAFPRTATISKKVFNTNVFPPSVSTINCDYTYGTGIVPAIIEAANSIDARNCHFEPNSRATIRAPHIELSPGFDARYGSVCEVINERMECRPYTQLYGNGGCDNIALKSASYMATGVLDKINKSIDLYPNPTSDNASLKFKNYEGANATIGIYNMVGKLIRQFGKVEILEAEQDYYLNLEGIDVGIYLVTIKQGDHTTTLKLQKN